MNASRPNIYWLLAESQITRAKLRFVGLFCLCVVSSALARVDFPTKLQYDAVFAFGAWAFSMALGLVIAGSWRLKEEDVRIAKTLPISKLQLGSYMWWQAVIVAPAFVQFATIPYFNYVAMKTASATPVYEWIFRGAIYISINGVVIGWRSTGCLWAVVPAGVLYYFLRSGYVIAPIGLALTAMAFALYSYRFRESLAPDLKREEVHAFTAIRSYKSYSETISGLRRPLWCDLYTFTLPSFITIATVAAALFAYVWIQKEKSAGDPISPVLGHVWAVGISLFATGAVHDQLLRQRTRVYRSLPISTQCFVLSYGVVIILTTFTVTILAGIVTLVMGLSLNLSLLTAPPLALGFAAAIGIDSFLPKRHFLDQAAKRLLMLFAAVSSLIVGTISIPLRVPIGIALFLVALLVLHALIKYSDGVHARYLATENRQ